MTECNEFLGEERSKAGKMHSSDVDSMLIPVKLLDHVAPPALHIMMGIDEKIYQILVDHCNDFDDDED